MRTYPDSGDLHGAAPGNCPAALLLIDVVNMEYPGGEKLLPYALPAGRAIAAVKRLAPRQWDE